MSGKAQPFRAIAKILEAPPPLKTEPFANFNRSFDGEPEAHRSSGGVDAHDPVFQTFNATINAHAVPAATITP